MSIVLVTHLYMSQSKRFIDYAPTSLERNYKYELLTEHDLGVHVDLILPEAYGEMGERVPPEGSASASSSSPAASPPHTASNSPCTQVSSNE